MVELLNLSLLLKKQRYLVVFYTISILSVPICTVFHRQSQKIVFNNTKCDDHASTPVIVIPEARRDVAILIDPGYVVTEESIYNLTIHT